jgi:toxin ParE1/3/4
MLEVRWAPQARTDLDKIDDYYRRIDPDVANRIARAAVAETLFLTQSPKAGAFLGEGPRRKWNVPKTPYLLIYVVRAAHLRILRARHARKDWKPASE